MLILKKHTKKKATQKEETFETQIRVLDHQLKEVLLQKFYLKKNIKYGGVLENKFIFLMVMVSLFVVG